MPLSERTFVQYPSTAASAGASWFLLTPPMRAYAADRSTMMGGPLATMAGEGGEEHGAYVLRSIDQPDMKAPLNKWTVLASFSSNEDCDDYKTKELADLDDPAWVAAQVRRSRGRMMDLPAMKDMIDSQRCASSLEISGK